LVFEGMDVLILLLGTFVHLTRRLPRE